MNSLPNLINFFSVEGMIGVGTDKCRDGKVTLAEFKYFWSSLSDSEKEYYKNVAI